MTQLDKDLHERINAFIFSQPDSRRHYGNIGMVVKVNGWQSFSKREYDERKDKWKNSFSYHHDNHMSVDVSETGEITLKELHFGPRTPEDFIAELKDILKE